MPNKEEVGDDPQGRDNLAGPLERLLAEAGEGGEGVVEGHEDHHQVLQEDHHLQTGCLQKFQLLVFSPEKGVEGGKCCARGRCSLGCLRSC